MAWMKCDGCKYARTFCKKTEKEISDCFRIQAEVEESLKDVDLSGLKQMVEDDIENA